MGGLYSRVRASIHIDKLAMTFESRVFVNRVITLSQKKRKAGVGNVPYWQRERGEELGAKGTKLQKSQKSITNIRGVKAP